MLGQVWASDMQATIHTSNHMMASQHDFPQPTDGFIAFPATAQSQMDPSNLPPTTPFYNPSFTLALTGTLLFATLTLIHAYLAWRTKTLVFITTIYAAAAMTAGMALRTHLSFSSPNKTLTETSLLLLTSPPSILSFLLLMTYTRLTWLLTPPQHMTPRTLWLPPLHQTLCLATPQVVGDTLAFFGSGFLFIPAAPAPVAVLGAVVEVGTWIVLAGVVGRLVVWSYWGKGKVKGWEGEWRGGGLGVREGEGGFGDRGRAGDEGEDTGLGGGYVSEKVREVGRKLGLAVAACCMLLVVCGIARVFDKQATAMLKAGTIGRLSIFVTEEWPAYAFSYIPIAGILAIMAVYHPGLYLPRRLTGFRLRAKQLLEEGEESRGGARKETPSQSSVETAV